MEQYVTRIHTVSDGNRTVAEATLLKQNEVGYIVETLTTGKGSAGREPGDKNNPEIGEKLALARALESAAAHLRKQANGRIRHVESVRAHREQIKAAKAAGGDGPGYGNFNPSLYSDVHGRYL